MDTRVGDIAGSEGIIGWIAISMILPVVTMFWSKCGTKRVLGWIPI